MEKIALFATDLDGTLFYDRQNITERDKNTLKKLKEKGCIICFATGREFEVITPALDRLELWDCVDYFIMSGGSQIYDVKNKKIQVVGELSPECMHYIYDKYHNMPAAVIIPRDNVFHTNRISDEIIEESKLLGSEIKLYDDMTEVLDKPNPKFLFFGTEKQIDETIAVMSNDTDPRLTICRSQQKYIDCYAAGINKGTALKVLCKQLNIDLKNTAAIGDNQNDIELFETVAFSACPLDATEDAKNKAEYICCNAHEGAVSDFCEYLNII